MKRLVVVLSSLLILPAFAEVAPSYYDDVIEYTDAEDFGMGVADDALIVGDDSSGATDVTSAPATTNSASRQTGRTTASRAIASGTRASRTNVTNGNSGATSRGVTGRGNSATSGASTVRATTSRAATARGTTAATQNSGTATRSATTTARSATPTSGTTAARASIVQTNTASQPLYNARVSSRVPTVRMATANMSATTTSTTSVAESTTSAAEDMDALAQMTDYCKAQYTQCMDNFCNVLDDNQGRCSCSKNINNYAKTETALKTATEELQDVAQKIQYIGLSADDIDTLFTQTEAELKMQSTTDSTQLKNDLDRIKNMIVDVKSGTASSTSDAGLSMDLSGLLDFSVSSTGFDLSALFGGTSSNTSSISNQRGEQLYKTAAARCKSAVLNTCSAQGVDISVITNSYDLEIDKQCIAYERALTDSNTEMVSTVRNAKNVLQKARLLVEQNKNQYDLRGCVNALDSCMQDDFVCGADYENCLDPTGKYIVNGAIVVGSMPGVPGGGISNDTANVKNGLYSVWDYKNGTDFSAFGNGSVAEYVGQSIYASTSDFASTTDNMAKYLQKKIGYADNNGKSVGMCMSVLNKCQSLTYGCKSGKTCASSDKVYKTDNDVVKNYLERVSMQIKTAQDALLSDYAENCISDVSTCLSSNNYYSLTGVTTDTTSVSAVAVSACRSVISTCMSVTGYGESTNANQAAWLKGVMGLTVSGNYMSLADIKTQRDCLWVYGTWGSGSCTCDGGNGELVSGVCACKDGYAGVITPSGSLKCFNDLLPETGADIVCGETDKYVLTASGSNSYICEPKSD